ncbi:MAG TPA: cytidylate kinase-like family protein [Ilumatobacteraceae bacterium]|jgi:cytidylate kinase
MMATEIEPTPRVLTVSATYGAGGSVIAPRLAVLLEVPFFDRLIHGEETRNVAKIAERLTREERDQAPPGRIVSGLTSLTSIVGMAMPSGGERDPRVQLREQVEASVRRIATTTGGVILGRAAAVVLGGDANAFNVRLMGPVDRRLDQASKVEGITRDDAQTLLADTDRAWARFVSRLFDRDPADPALYHLVLDSTVLPLDRSAEMIKAIAEEYWARS